MCEDAATFKQKSGTSYVNGGGARNADDKVLQHNGGGTVAVKNFMAQNVGKVYRSCGNCDTQYARKSTFTNIKVSKAKVVAGVNGNLGGKLSVPMVEGMWVGKKLIWSFPDSTSISSSCLLDTPACWLYKGNDSGAEPSKTASAPDGKVCATSAVKSSGC